MAEVKLLHVPYKGDAAAVTALLGGEIDFIVAPATTVLSHIKAGKFTALGVSANTRWAGLPAVPTVIEGGVEGFDVRSWTGLAAPAGTPRPIVNRLNAELLRALQVPEVRARLEQIGGEVRGSTPDETRIHVASEVQRWSKVIREANIERQ
jgi:tripartite-type tricarboxylate transporter receptor subunit TctC